MDDFVVPGDLCENAIIRDAVYVVEAPFAESLADASAVPWCHPQGGGGQLLRGMTVTWARPLATEQSPGSIVGRTMARPSRFLLLLLCGVLPLIAYAVWVAAPWATGFEWAITAATTALVLLSIAAGDRPAIRIGIAVAVLAALLSILCATALGAQ